MTTQPQRTPQEPQAAQTPAAALTYVAAKLRASDDYLGFGARWAYYDNDQGFKVAEVAPEHAGWLSGRLRSGLDAYGPHSSYDTLEEAIAECAALATLSEKLRTGAATEDERQQARDEVAQARALKAARTRKEQKLAKQTARTGRPTATAKAKDVAGSVPHVTVVAPFVPAPVLDPAPVPAPVSVPVAAAPALEPQPAVPVTPASVSAPAPRARTAEDRAPKGTTAAYAVAALRAAERDPLVCSSTDALRALGALPAGADGQAQARKALADEKLAARFAGFWDKRLAVLRADRDQGR